MTDTLTASITGTDIVRSLLYTSETSPRDWDSDFLQDRHGEYCSACGATDETVEALGVEVISRAWDEAHAENGRRTPINEWEEELMPSGDLVITDAPPVEDDAADRVARALGANEAQLAKLRGIIEARRTAERTAEELRSQVAALQLRAERAEADISDGGDPRLVPFWEGAAEQAEDAGYCSEYDRMARMLNGVPRKRPYDVEVTFSIRGRLRVEARSAEDAESIVSDMAESEVWRDASVDLPYDIDTVEVGDIEEVD